MIKYLKIFFLFLIFIILVIKPVLCLTNTEQKDHAYLQYKKNLGKLSNKKINSTIKAKDLCLKFLALNKNQNLKNKAFKDFRNLYFKVAYNLNQASDFGNGTDEYFINYFKKNGYSLFIYEGLYTLYEDGNFFKKHFLNFLTPDWKEYFELRILEQNKLGYSYTESEPGANDELRKQIILWEKFINKYPNFSEINEVKAKLYDYFYYYMLGQFNYNYENGNIEAELKKSYENFLSLNKNSKFYPTVKRYYEIIKRNNFKRIWHSSPEEGEVINDVAYKNFKFNNPYPSGKCNSEIYIGCGD